MEVPVVKSRFFVTAMMMSLCLFMIPALCLYADTPLQGSENSSYLLRIFEGKYLEISDRVSQGELPADILVKANRIRAHLKKTFIKYNAEMEMLKVDIIDGTKEESIAALDQMSVLVNDSEQNKVHYLQKLTMLAPIKPNEEASAVMPSQEIPAADYFETGGKKQVVTVIKTVESSPKAEADKPKVKKEDIWETKDVNLRMQLSPADMTQGEIE
jgi:hypothetical protein